MTAYTYNYRFSLPDYNIVGWGDSINNNFLSIDTILGQFTSNLALQGVWKNSTLYPAGVSVIDSNTGHIWYNAVIHTSLVAPSTFNDERATYPSYWTDITNPAIPAAASATAAAASATLAATSAATASSASLFRNRLINGNMSINQRGGATYNPPTAYTKAANYTVDRWVVIPVGFSPVVTPTSVSGYNSARQLKIAGLMPGAASVALQQRIESAETIDLVGKSVTFSVQLAVSLSNIANTTYTINILTPNVADVYGAVTLLQSLTIHPVDSNPATYSVTVNNLPASVLNGLMVSVSVASGATGPNLTMFVTSATLEIGTVANAYEHIPYVFEFLKCQRYYQSIGYTFLKNGIATVSDLNTVSFMSPMRAVPTLANTVTTMNNCSGVGVANINNGFSVYAQCIATGTMQYAGNVIMDAEV